MLVAKIIFKARMDFKNLAILIWMFKSRNFSTDSIIFIDI